MTKPRRKREKKLVGWTTKKWDLKHTGFGGSVLCPLITKYKRDFILPVKVEIIIREV